LVFVLSDVPFGTAVSQSLPSVAKPGSSAAEPPAPATKLVAAGVARAKAETRLVLVDFGASWCGWCHRFDKFLADTASAGRTMRSHFVIVPLIVLESPGKEGLNNPGSDSLLRSYRGGKDGGIPFFAILDADGKTLGTSNAMPDGSNIGHPAVETEFEAFDRLLSTVAPRITQAERDDIRSYLRKMAEKK
jgi:thiol-disulfide isomerase/thioredoxin